MSFHDDSHILSRLGILDSSEESPKKGPKPSPPGNCKKSKETPERENFVEVNIDGDVDSEDSESDDAIFDQDSLLTQSRPRVMRRRVESFTCRYILLMFSYISLGAICHSSAGITNHANSAHKLYVFQSAGMLLGVLLGRLTFFRMCSALIFVLNLFLATVMSAFLYSIPNSVNIDAISVVQGCVVGILSYGGLCLYFSLWRGHSRKILWFYVLFALGSGLILLFSAHPATSIESTTVSVVKRQAALPEMLETSQEESNSTEPPPKKPQVAQGISSISTKTQQNKEMREKAQEKEEAGLTNATEDVSKEAGSPSTSTTITSTTTTTTTTTSTTTTTPPTTTITVPLTHAVETKKEDVNRRGKDRYQLSIPNMNEYLPNASAELFLLFLLIFTSTLHILGFVCCCTPFKLGSDPKIVKLRDPSMPSFTLGCRIRLVAFYLICGLIESVLMMFLTSTGRQEGYLLPWTAVGARFLLLIPATFSLSIVFLTALIGVSSAVCLWLSLIPSISLVLLCSACALLPFLVLLNIESRLSPRPSVLTDHFLGSHFAGRFLAAFSCWLIGVSDYLRLIVFSFVLLLIALFLLTRSINKAVRLKEIMDYTGAQGTMGDYLALVEREQLTLSDEEDGVEL